MPFSPELTNLLQINKIKRPTDIPDTGLLCDLLWSDPDDRTDYWDEIPKSVSYLFGRKVVKKFLRKNSLELLCRAHQVVEKGYEYFADGKLVTIFSAANYLGEFDNLGSMMTVDESLEVSFQVIDKKISRN